MTADGRKVDPHEAEERPMVGDGGGGWATPLGMVGAVLLGGVVFWQMTAQRLRAEEGRAPAETIEESVRASFVTPPLPLTEPMEGDGDAEPAVQDLALDAPTEGDEDLQERFSSPSLVVDLTTAPAVEASRGGSNVARPGRSEGAAGGSALSSDELFASRLGLGAGELAVARPLADPSRTIVQGAVIPAVLETAINSDLPGYVRALVSRDVRSFDGSTILVPRGSRLVGQYRAGVALGQSRVFVIWTRLIRPDGINVEIAAPGTDELGRGGLRGRVDRHFIQRFGGAVLLSLISSLGQDASDTQVIIASTRSAEGAAAVALQRDLDIAPTVEVAQGAAIRIFVTQDMDFSVVAASP